MSRPRAATLRPRRRRGRLQEKVSWATGGSQSLTTGRKLAQCFYSTAPSSQSLRGRPRTPALPPPPRPRRRHGGLRRRSDFSPRSPGTHVTLKLVGHIRQEGCLVRGDGGGGGVSLPEAGVSLQPPPSSRWAAGRRRLYCTCTCSKAQRAWPAAGRARPPRAGAQTQQRCPRPVCGAR